MSDIREWLRLRIGELEIGACKSLYPDTVILSVDDGESSKEHDISKQDAIKLIKLFSDHFSLDSKEFIGNGDSYLEDKNGNKSYVWHFGSVEKAQEALDSLVDCFDCTNCIGCTGCAGCVGCKYCIRCVSSKYCVHCTGSSDRVDCTGSSDRSDCGLNGCVERNQKQK